MTSIKRAHGFTLIEVVAALIASTVLLVGMASAIVIATNLLQTPVADQETWHEREMIDRISSDLRFATDINDSSGYGFAITKTSVGGNAEVAQYEAYLDGLTRRVGSGPAMQLDSVAPSQQSYVDGFSGASVVPTTSQVRVRSTSEAANSSGTNSLTIDVPPGSKTGDLMLLCVSSKSPSSFSISPDGWQSIHALSIDSLRLLVAYRFYDSSWTTSTITPNSDSTIAATMLSIENVSESAPVHWSGQRSGFCLSFLSGTHPTPNEPANFNEGQLNVQIFAADRDPWSDGTFGMAGFTGVSQVTAAESSYFTGNTIGVLVRSGPSPTLSSTPRMLHLSSGYWLQSSICLEPSQ